MKVLKAVILSVSILAIALVPTFALAQTPTPTPEGMQPSVITTELADLAFWLMLLLTLVGGAIGGVVYELLILQGNIERPHKLTEEEIAEKYPYAIAKYMFDLGIWARVVIGALAAVVALLILSPSTTFGLLATAVVAGSAGTSVFRSMQDRLVAAMAQKDTAEAKDDNHVLANKVDKIQEAYEELKKKVMEVSSSPAGSTKLKFEESATLNLDDLTQVGQLLSEARGIYEKML